MKRRQIRSFCRPFAAVALLLLALVLTVACGGSEDSGETSELTTTGTVGTTTVATTYKTTVTTAATTTASTVVTMTTASTRVTAKVTTETTAATTAAVTTTSRRPDGVAPIIIVPGILGSELVDSSGKQVWPIELSMSGMQKISKLKLDGSSGVLTPISLTPVTDAIENSENIGSENTYMALALALSEEFGSDNVYFFGYDWRQDLRVCAADLASYIETVKAEDGDGEVRVVAHSMGGLVLGAYLTDCHAKSIPSSVGCAVTVGSPFGGSEMATTLVGGYGNMFIRDYVGDSGVAGAGLSDMMLTTISNTLTAVAKTFPSIYTLLPEASYDKLGDTMTTQTAILGRETAEWLRASVTTAFADIEHYNVIGEGLDTLESADPSGAKVKVGGDGTVTCESATASFSAKTRAFDGIDHNELVTDGAATAYIVECIGK